VGARQFGGVAQPGRAPVLQAGCRRFDSCRLHALSPPVANGGLAQREVHELARFESWAGHRPVDLWDTFGECRQSRKPSAPDEASAVNLSGRPWQDEKLPPSSRIPSGEVLDCLSGCSGFDSRRERVTYTMIPCHVPANGKSADDEARVQAEREATKRASERAERDRELDRRGRK
jgi:hypothetical protein